MAIYRTVHISFWQDPFILELTPEGKYFYIYLMTNSKTNQLGCYEISLKTIVDETGYSKETIEKLIDKFVDDKKIMYSKQTNEIFLLNWHKYSWSKSPKVETCIKKEFLLVKNDEFRRLLATNFIDHRYSIDSLWIKETETKEETKTKTETYKEERKSTDYDSVVDLYNTICKSYSKTTKISDARRKAIKARFNSYTLDDFKRLFKMAEESDFLKGKNDRNWTANFDWLIKDCNMAKVLDGNYINKTNTTPSKPSTNKFNNYPQRSYTATDFSEHERILMAKMNEKL